MMKLFSFEPELFNNNGDQGNLLMLQRAIEASGSQHQIAHDPKDADFVLVGDCALAVLNRYGEALTSMTDLLQERLGSGRATLLVGRSYELLAPKLGIALQEGERVSKYVEVNTELGSVFGYHNSEVLAPRVFISGAFIGTTLFGPILAKNPVLLSRVMGAMGLQLGGAFLDETNDIAQKIREAITF